MKPLERDVSALPTEHPPSPDNTVEGSYEVLALEEVLPSQVSIEAATSLSVPLETTETLTAIPLLTQTRSSRLEAESYTPSDHTLHRFMRKPVFWGVMKASDIAEWVLEFSPLRFIWGPGDLLSLSMGLTQKNLLTGEKIDPYEAKLCMIAAAIPFIPSKAIRGPARIVRHTLEETHHAIRTGDFSTIRRAVTLRNALKLVFAIL